VFECDTPSVLFVGDRVLETRPSEIGMVFVLVPTSVKSRVWVGVVDTALLTFGEKTRRSSIAMG